MVTTGSKLITILESLKLKSTNSVYSEQMMTTKFITGSGHAIILVPPVQVLNGGPSHVTSGLLNAYGVSSYNLAWQMKLNVFNEQTVEFDLESLL